MILAPVVLGAPVVLAATAEASGETFSEFMDHVAQGFEALGAVILVVGVVWSLVLAAVTVRRSGLSALISMRLR